MASPLQPFSTLDGDVIPLPRRWRPRVPVTLNSPDAGVGLVLAEDSIKKKPISAPPSTKHTRWIVREPRIAKGSKSRQLIKRTQITEEEAPWYYSTILTFCCFRARERWLPDAQHTTARQKNGTTKHKDFKGRTGIESRDGQASEETGTISISCDRRSEQTDKNLRNLYHFNS